MSWLKSLFQNPEPDYDSRDEHIGRLESELITLNRQRSDLIRAINQHENETRLRPRSLSDSALYRSIGLHIEPDRFDPFETMSRCNAFYRSEND